MMADPTTERLVAQKITGEADPVTGRSRLTPIAGGYGPGVIKRGGPKPGAAPRQQMPTFHPQDRALLKKLSKQYKKQGEVTVAEGPDGYQYALPNGKKIDTPSTFQKKNGGTRSWTGKQNPAIGLPITGGKVL